MENVTTDRSSDLEANVRTLNDLIQLDYDAVQAYEQAIERVDADDVDVRVDLDSFRQDHERHISDLQNAVRVLGGQPKDPSRDLKGLLLEGLTALRSATGTLGALKAMRMNEKVTNKSYSKAADIRLPFAAREVVARNFDDERRHLSVIKAHIARLDEDAAQEIDEDVEEEDVVSEEGVVSDDVRPGAGY